MYLVLAKYVTGEIYLDFVYRLLVLYFFGNMGVKVIYTVKDYFKSKLINNINTNNIENSNNH
jgi:hypothetical protein